MSAANTQLEHALNLQRKNQLDAALAAYREVLRELPENAVAHTGIAIILQQHGKLTDAERHIQIALSATGDKSVQLGILASNLIEQGRVEEACEAAGEACRLNPVVAQLQSNRLLYSLYDPRLSTDQRYALHREWGRRCGTGQPHRPGFRGRAPRARVSALAIFRRIFAIIRWRRFSSRFSGIMITRRLRCSVTARCWRKMP